MGINYSDGWKICDLRNALVRELSGIYGKREGTRITEWLFHYLADTGKTEFMLNPDRILGEAVTERLLDALGELKKGRPVQYVTGKTEFYGLTLEVDERVLIPRPETEELVKWAIDDHPLESCMDIADLGTGSGCIAIALQKHYPDSRVIAYDISRDALDLAGKNAAYHATPVIFQIQDILEAPLIPTPFKFDLIISNPPYVTESEKKAMRPNVIDYEPHVALFVPDDDPLLFYRAISGFSFNNLKDNGWIYVEVNERFAKETAQAFREAGFSRTQIRKDLNGKERMVKAGRW